MNAPCLYCRGSGRFRHERPRVSDHFWLQMTGGTMRCPLCKGVGKITRPVESPILDTGLIFCRTRDGLTLAGCPEADCVKWIDVTSFFETRRSFEGTCSAGHAITMEATRPPGVSR